jgi:hypothetical protein
MPCTSMERPERYDPEDIEHLLSERPFHQLLAEEKAYVLRHIADAEEYERMRALLLHLREGEQQHAPVMPDSGDRERVLAAFRERQQPVWRVWLNSIAAFIAQGQEGFAWRPALALAGVALVLVVGVTLVLRTTGDAPPQVAELAPPKKERVVPAVSGTTATEVAAATAADQQAPGNTELAKGGGTALQEVTTNSLEVLDHTTTLPAVSAVVAEEVASDDAASLDVVEAERSERLAASPATRDAQPYSVVLEQELARNATTGNVTGTVSARGTSARGRMPTLVEDRSRNVADDSELLALLRSGW